MASESDKHGFGMVSQGLDRAEIGVSPQVKGSHPRPQAGTSHYRKPSIRRTLGDLTFLPFVAHPHDGLRKLKRTVKDKRADATDQPTAPEEAHAPLLAPAPDIGSDERLEHDLRARQKYPPIKQFIQHPVSALQTVARDQGGDDFAENVARSEVPHGASVILLRQEQKVDEATDGNQEAEQETLTQLKHARQDAFVRWSMDRHVRRVKRLHDPATHPQLPGFRDSWSHWISYSQQLLQDELQIHGAEPLNDAPERAKPTEALLASSVERVVIVSAPFQDLMMHLRGLSLWKNPSRSATCMVVYFVLVLFNLTTRAAILLIIFGVFYRRWHPRDLSELRGVVTKAENQNASVHDLTELILQYGTRGWVDQVIDQAGPILLHRSEHTADVLERIQKQVSTPFYEWRDPPRTRIMLSKLVALVILITLAPTWLLVQMSFFAAGIMFFIMEPIRNKFPRYRLLTSPMTWLMWKIPTHAEWAIARLQAEAASYIADDVHGAAADDPAAYSERTSGAGNVRMIGNYNCTAGVLKVTTRSISLSPNGPAGDGWCLRYHELDSMHKVENPTRSKEMKGLNFVTVAGETLCVYDLLLRDEIFSQILGYSGLRWKKIE
ncbi:uncharacterized protein HMPREF1541_05332 [Cyphellophora europaea CBS 101466]|uniref:Uncharacterized protein n=1 Tax=Cyphellophora europaea (strain CBS 101466) TaxID=1220924 RepID=W2RS23_CYPE1|nr:uncharacterized protein HMPREF1541_05332 [Cyphellophora europaea CBS 101466]ETN39110.1 hypothetical protein HMPREF1541_05332 [Cyphellophora europaea CBS 101466]